MRNLCCSTRTGNRKQKPARSGPRQSGKDRLFPLLLPRFGWLTFCFAFPFDVIQIHRNVYMLGTYIYFFVLVRLEVSVFACVCVCVHNHPPDSKGEVPSKEKRGKKGGRRTTQNKKKYIYKTSVRSGFNVGIVQSILVSSLHPFLNLPLKVFLSSVLLLISYAVVVFFFPLFSSSSFPFISNLVSSRSEFGSVLQRRLVPDVLDSFVRIYRRKIARYWGLYRPISTAIGDPVWNCPRCCYAIVVVATSIGGVILRIFSWRFGCCLLFECCSVLECSFCERVWLQVGISRLINTGTEGEKLLWYVMPCLMMSRGINFKYLTREFHFNMNINNFLIFNNKILLIEFDKLFNGSIIITYRPGQN